jgi:hypothetical protein
MICWGRRSSRRGGLGEKKELMLWLVCLMRCWMDCLLLARHFGGGGGEGCRGIAGCVVSWFWNSAMADWRRFGRANRGGGAEGDTAVRVSWDRCFALPVGVKNYVMLRISYFSRFFVLATPLRRNGSVQKTHFPVLLGGEKGCPGSDKKGLVGLGGLGGLWVRTLHVLSVKIIIGWLPRGANFFGFHGVNCTVVSIPHIYCPQFDGGLCLPTFLCWIWLCLAWCDHHGV